MTLCPLLGLGVMGRSTQGLFWLCLQTAISWIYSSIKMGLGGRFGHTPMYIYGLTRTPTD